MTLNRKEIDAIAGGEFQLDCARMSLIDHAGTPRFTGAGEISIDEVGRLGLVLYAPDYVIGSDDLFPEGLKAGEFIPSTAFYRLEARDVSGRTWEAHDIRPDVSGVYGEGGAVVRARLREITHRAEPTRSEGVMFWLHFHGLDKIPLNAGTRTLRERSKGKSEAFKLDQWVVEDDEVELLFTAREQGFEVQARASAEPSSHGFDTRLEESLWFALGHLLEWDILVESRPDGYRAAIRERREDPRRTGFRPPVEYTGRLAENDVGRIIMCYLRFLKGYGEPRYHPLSALIRRAIRASAGSIEDYALALSVGVEGVVTAYLAERGAASDDVVRAVDAATDHLGNGTGYDSILPRIEGCLRAIKGTSSRTALSNLANENLIAGAGREAWEALRHPVAHGAEYAMEYQALYSKAAWLHRLFVELVLRVIGYSGPYTDHTTPGWPTIEME